MAVRGIPELIALSLITLISAADADTGSDAFADAPPVGEDFAMDAEGSGFEAGEVHPGEIATGSVWVRWTAPESGIWLVRTPRPSRSVPWSFLEPEPLFPIPEFEETRRAWQPEAPDQSGRTPELRRFDVFGAVDPGQPLPALDRGLNYVLFEAEAGQEYRIAGYAVSGRGSRIALRLRRAAKDDERTGAVDLGTASYVSSAGNFLGATAGGTEIEDFPVTATVWRKWTAPSSGTVRLALDRASHPSRAIGVFSGSDEVGGLIPDENRIWSFEAEAGESYAIRISTAGDGASGFTMRLVADEPADAFDQALPAGETATHLATEGLTAETGEPSLPESAGSAWLRWRSDTRQVVSARALTRQAPGRVNDTEGRLEVFRGDVLGELERVTDTEEGHLAHFPAEAGAVYHFRFLTPNGQGGAATFQLATRLLEGEPEDLLAEAGAILYGVDPDRKTRALALAREVLNRDPAEPRAHTAAALLELKLAGETPTGRVIAARLAPDYSDRLPVRFIAAVEAAPAGDLPDGLSFAEFLARLNNETDARLVRALEHLQAVPADVPVYDHAQLPLRIGARGIKERNETDAHDRSVLAAMIQGYRGGLELLRTWDIQLPAAEIFAWLSEGSPSLETLLARDPAFLTGSASGAGERIRQRFAEAANAAARASQLYDPPSSGIFHRDASLFQGNAQGAVRTWRHWLESMAGPAENLAGERVNLSVMLENGYRLRPHLPNVSGNDFRAFTATDPEFGGLLPGADDADLHRAWAEREWLLGSETLAEWIARKLPEEGYSADDDPDGDGFPLRHEYLFGLSPIQQEATSYQPRFSRQRNEDGTWTSTLTYRRRIASEEYRYLAEYSDDLIHWELMLDEALSSHPLPGFETVRVQPPDPPSESELGQRYFRIKLRKAGTGGGVVIEW